ncbi:MAG: hypothetical protein J4473_01195 [Candidatus Aenigmarchaeota archaeon]|nr:hypothetical protein [Candidatus Aenigmarchaeota archaeon]
MDRCDQADLQNRIEEIQYVSCTEIVRPSGQEYDDNIWTLRIGLTRNPNGNELRGLVNMVKGYHGIHVKNTEYIEPEQTLYVYFGHNHVRTDDWPFNY